MLLLFKVCVIRFAGVMFSVLMFSTWVSQGFWRGNVPALLMVMPYTSIQFTVLHKLKSFASGSTKTGNESTELHWFLSIDGTC